MESINIIAFWISTPESQKVECSLVADAYLIKVNLSLVIYHCFQAMSRLLFGHKCSHLQQHMAHPLHPAKDTDFN